MPLSALTKLPAPSRLRRLSMLPKRQRDTALDGVGQARKVAFDPGSVKRAAAARTVTGVPVSRATSAERIPPPTCWQRNRHARSGRSPFAQGLSAASLSVDLDRTCENEMRRARRRRRALAGRSVASTFTAREERQRIHLRFHASLQHHVRTSAVRQ